MSTTKMYSRGLMMLAGTCLGGSTIARKKFSLSPRNSITPDSMRSPARR